MTMRICSRLFPLVGFAALLYAPTLCGAQDAGATPQAAGQTQMPVAPTIKKEARLVLVDTVVTDKKGNYVRDLSQNDFKLYEDNKEQAITSFSSGSGAAAPQGPNQQKHYLVLFFDNSSMALPDQLQARAAATKFNDANAAPDHMMAV